MSTTVDMTTFDAYLKEWYVDSKRLYKMDEYGNELLGLMPKETDASGDTWVQPIEAAGVVGDSATYASINASAGLDTKFYGTWKNRYAQCFIDDKVIELSSDTRGSFKSVTTKMESVRKQFLESTDIQLFRDEGGSIARLSAGVTVASTSGTLDSLSAPMAQFIKNGMTLTLSPNSDGTSVRSGTVTVLGSNGRDTFYTTANISTGISAAAASDYVYKSGDEALALAGLASWVPQTDALAGVAFKNVTRTKALRELGGIRLDASGLTVEESLVQAVSDAQQFGANPDAVFLHPRKHAALVKELGSRIIWDRTPGVDLASGRKSDTFGFSGIKVACGGTPVMVYKDSACQSSLGWVLEMDTWRFTTARPWPHVRDKDGLKMLRQAGTNYIFEMLGYGELLGSAPGHNVVINFGS